jgi:hypothetical protein
MRHIGNVQVSGSLQQQGSDDNRFLGNVTVSESIIYADGSTIFGRDGDETHTFSGSLLANNLYYTTAVGQISQRSSKENIRSIDDIVDSSYVIDNLIPRVYELISDTSDSDRFGFIVDEVEDILPQVIMNAPFGFQGLDYVQLISIITRELQKLRQRVAQLESGSV